MPTTTTTLTDEIALRSERSDYVSVSRDEAITAIRFALKRRSGKAWSVKGGTGTAWGWITVSAPPARRTADWVKVGTDEYDAPIHELVGGEAPEGGVYMTPEDSRELADLLNLDRVHFQGYSIASSNDHYIEAVARAEGRAPSRYGAQYWD